MIAVVRASIAAQIGDADQVAAGGENLRIQPRHAEGRLVKRRWRERWRSSPLWIGCSPHSDDWLHFYFARVAGFVQRRYGYRQRPIGLRG